MITLSRRLAAELWSVLRRVGGRARGYSPALLFSTAPDGMRVSTRMCDVAVAYHVPGNLPEEQFWVPSAFLADCEGKQDEPVQLELSREGRAVATWSDGGVPQRVQYDQVQPADVPDLPGQPQEFMENPPELLPALYETMTTTDQDSIRYAISCVQFRGRSGTLAATDGRQMLLVGGFTFPWTENVLIPNTKIFGHRALPQDQPVNVGRTGDWVVFAVGPWTFWLAVNKDGKFPDVDRQIPRVADAVSRCRFAPADAEFLGKAMPKLPSEETFNSPVTLDLNGAVVVRACPQSSAEPAETKPTEIVLSQSVPSGEAIRINTNRRYLARALSLGFREVLLYGNTLPVMCRDKKRSYIWALLGPESAIAPTENAVRIVSSVATATETTPQPKPPRRKSDLSEPTNNQNGETRSEGMTAAANRIRRKAKQRADQHEVGSLIEQAETLRTSLRDNLLKTSELIKGLKRHRQQSRIVQNTLASLRQIKTLNV